MARQPLMMRFARWHVWLGWIVGVPILMWCATGLVMVAKPIEEVRGNHLRIEQASEPLLGNPQPIFDAIDRPQRMPIELVTTVQRGTMVTRAIYADGQVERYSALGNLMPPLTEDDARTVVRNEIKGGDQVTGVRFFAAEDAPLDLRRPIASWQVALADGTHVYVGRDSGEIEAVRTRWWRFFDFVWGLHIMDLQTREDTHHPVLVIFAALSVLGALLGCVLMFRRRKARATA